MKFTTFVLAAVAAGAAVWSAPIQKRGVDPNLVNKFNVQSGIPFGDGSADCKGFNNARIPCQCPPDFNTFVDAVSDAVAHGFVPNNPTVLTPSFPTDNSKSSQNTRLHVCAVVLQNLNGAGKGCPVVATNYSDQQKAIDALPNTPAPPATAAAPPAKATSPAAAPPPAVSTTAAAGTTTALPPPDSTSSADSATCPPPVTVTVSAATETATAVDTVDVSSSAVATDVASSTAAAPPAVSTTAAASTVASAPAVTATSASGLTDAQIIALAPSLGFTAGKNPTGTGDCDGAVNGADGKPIKVPCACPPSDDVYHAALIADVRAGFAIHNPTVKVSYPTGTSNNDIHGRITAASIVLQNLNGEGKGCPIVSTTLQAQDKALN